MDATCLAASGESPRGDVRGRRVSDPTASIDGLPSSVRPRLKHSSAERRCSRIAAEPGPICGFSLAAG